MAAAPPWWQEQGAADGLVVMLTVHVQPGARNTEVAGTHGDALKIRLAAPPVEGKANAALLRFIANAFDVPLRQVVLVRGEISRRKVLRIEAPLRRPAWAAAGERG